MALEKLHESKIVHQDIQPSNILIDSDGHIKLSGFGNSYYKLLKNNNFKHNKLNMNEKDNQGYMLDYFNVGTLCY